MRPPFFGGIMSKKVKRGFLVIGILIIAVGIWCGIWYLYRENRFGEFNEMTNGEDGANVNGYLYATFMPDSITKVKGNISVCESRKHDKENNLKNDVIMDLLIFLEFPNRISVRVDLEAGSEELLYGYDGFSFNVDDKMNLVDETDEAKAYYNEYYDDLYDIFSEAHAYLGILEVPEK